MYEVSKETLENAYKPYDVVTIENGDVGFISEVCVNRCQPEAKFQISYSITWLVGDTSKTAWYNHDELTRHCNIFMRIAELSCNTNSNSKYEINNLFTNWGGLK